jgi:DNA invertase Pin-like site-specific DNA recombinase
MTVVGDSAMKAVCYYRTSSRTNIGFDKDSLPRQQTAVRAYAKANGIQIVDEFYDEAVSGTDAIDARAGFSEMLGSMGSSGATVILVESASRFARDLIVQMTGHQKLQELGFDLVAVDSPTTFTDDSPTAELLRSLMGAVSSFERATVVSRLKSGRERKKKLTGKGQGRKSLTEIYPELKNKAQKLRRQGPAKGRKLSYDKVAEALFVEGYTTKNGNRFSASTVKGLVQ